MHARGSMLGAASRDVIGDALWAMMIAWWVGAAAPRLPLARRSVIAYTVCATVETSQLIRAPWLDSIRETRLGHLVLGSGFDPRDLVAYALGVAAAAALEWSVTRRTL